MTPKHVISAARRALFMLRFDVAAIVCSDISNTRRTLFEQLNLQVHIVRHVNLNSR